MNRFKKNIKDFFVKKNEPEMDFRPEPTISGPGEVKHHIHVAYNPDTKSLEGLPDIWKSALKQAVR